MARCCVPPQVFFVCTAPCVRAQDSEAATAPQSQPQTSPSSGLDPQSPLAPMPGLGVDWPDLDAAPPEPVDPADPAEAKEMTGESRYSYRIDGIDAVASPLLNQRFLGLSTLDAHDGEPANAAQLDRRAREDSTLLVGLLRAEGYYDARVTTRVEQAAGRPVVVLDAEPGVIYKFEGVTIAGVAAAGDKEQGLREAFGVKADDVVNADRIAAGEAQLRTAIGERGFPLRTWASPRSWSITRPTPPRWR